MKGMQLRIYTYENRRHGGLPVHEWLLGEARKAGISGGSAFRAMAGFGRHGRLHEQAFFELAGEEPVLVKGNRGIRILDDRMPPPDDPVIGPRVGISKATEHPWRWYVPGNPNVSAHPSRRPEVRP